jgi:hypothetical protein
MKSLWRKVVPMVRCWKVLVPIVMEAGYESVISSLEKMLMMPEVVKSLSLTIDSDVKPHHILLKGKTRKDQMPDQKLMQFNFYLCFIYS